MLLDGKFVSLIRKGEGEKVLLLHGYLSKKESFYYQIEFLSKHFEVIAPDFPGFGASAPIDAAWSVGDYAEWLIRFMKAQDLDSVHLISHSFGARVAFKAIAAHHEIAQSLIITGGAGLVKPRSKKYLKKVKAYRRYKKIFPKFAERHFGSAEYRTLSPIMRESYKKIVNEDLSADAALVACKTYLLYGNTDTVTPPAEEGRTFHNLIAGSRFETIDGGHFCFSEHPDIFNTKIYKFLTE